MFYDTRVAISIKRRELGLYVPFYVPLCVASCLLSEFFSRVHTSLVAGALDGFTTPASYSTRYIS